MSKATDLPIVAGKTYRTSGGGELVCKWWNPADRSAHLTNTQSGWDFVAHGVRINEDGTIWWDYSTGGKFAEK